MHKIDLMIESLKKYRKEKRKQMSQQVKDLEKKADLHGLRGDSTSQTATRKIRDTAEKVKDAVVSKMSKKQQRVAGELYRPLRKGARHLKKAGKKGISVAATGVVLGMAAKKYAEAKEKAKEKLTKKKKDE